MVEWQRATKAIPFLRGPVSAMLTEDMRGEHRQINQTHSFAFFGRLYLSRANAEILTFRIEEDFWYRLTALRVGWPPELDQEPAPELFFRLYWQSPDRAETPRQLPVPLRNTTTPADQQRRLYAIELECLFPPASFVKLEVSGQAGTNPEYVDVLTEGVKIPRKYRIVG